VSHGAAETAARLIPPEADYDELRDAAGRCTACPLYARATQTVFGEGPVPARLMLVGETPGDQEDRQGHPFVGPAGKLLDRCLEAAGIDRNEAYVTNVVKHFKWTERGKRRLHGKPSAGEIRACKPWYEAEAALVKPHVLVLLGATAAQAALGPQFRVSRQRGDFVPSNLAPYMLATVHPSSLLRGEPETRELEIVRFIADLRKAAMALKR
jgi:uracil-DNA glycosylase